VPTRASRVFSDVCHLPELTKTAARCFFLFSLFQCYAVVLISDVFRFTQMDGVYLVGFQARPRRARCLPTAFAKARKGQIGDSKRGQC